MNKLLKEPLVHFLFLGVLIYLMAIFTASENNEQKIIVTQGKLEQLATLFRKTWQRSASPEEFTKIVDEYVLEQAAYLEGVNLGLDKNDIVITRRVRQKLDFIAEDSGPKTKVTDEILSKYLLKNKNNFYSEDRYSFKQVFFESSNKSNNEKINQTLARLTTSVEVDISQLGNSSYFPSSFIQVSASEVERKFGTDFLSKLSQMTEKTWQGIVYSAYGAHLIYIESKEAGALPALADIRDKVKREWENEQQQQAIKQYYKELLTRYPATIMWPEETTKLTATPKGKG